MPVEFIVNEGNERIFVNVKTHSISVTTNTVPVFSFDPRGRLIGAYISDHNFKRGLDNRVIEKWWSADNGISYRMIRDLEGAEKKAFLDKIYSKMRSIDDALKKENVRIVSPESSKVDPIEEANTAFEKILTYDYESLEKERQKFLSIYKPVSILPTDQYLALVLQVTEGCSYNKCTFCNFYRDREFKIKSDQELIEHIKRVREFFGESIIMRKSIFLGDANALVIPQEKLLRIFDTINEEFAIVPNSLNPKEIKQFKEENHLHYDGIYSFIDAFNIRRKSVDDFAELKKRNLRRVYIGMETGCNRLLEFLNKPGSSEDIFDAVSTIKTAGLSVGIIIMAGIGGDKFSDRHVKDTIELVNRMNLDCNDFIYFSEFVEHCELEYSEKAKDEGIESLNKEDMHKQIRSMREGIKSLNSPKPPKVSVYDIREYLY